MDSGNANYQIGLRMPHGTIVDNAFPHYTAQHGKINPHSLSPPSIIISSPISFIIHAHLYHFLVCLW